MARGGGSVKVEGLTALVRDMQALGVEVDDLKAAFGTIADRGAQLAASFAPRRTGKLAASIKPSKAKNKAIVRAGGARVPYAGAVNYGWPAHGIRASRFLQRTDEALAPDAVNEIDTALTKLITDLGLS